MDPNTGRLLRLLAITAYDKMNRNKHKNVPGKWEEVGFNPQGERDWKHCTPDFLRRKLGEEFVELLSASLGEGNLLEEAGDVVAMAMMVLANKWADRGLLVNIPKIVCLCGSTKFKQEFNQANFEETMEGRIVLSVGFFAHVDTSHTLTVREKEQLDDLHFRKIDLCDEVLVINVGDYVGHSTSREIRYARSLDKAVRYLRPHKPRADLLEMAESEDDIPV